MSTQPTPTQKVKDEIKKEVEKIPPTTDQNLMAAMSYVWIISLIMLVVRRDNEFIQLHAKQGIVLFLISLFGFIPVLGWIAWVLAVIGMIVGFMNAWQGKRIELPIVYGLSKKINL